MTTPPVLVYRIGNYFHRSGAPLLGKVFTYLNRLLFSTWLPSSAKIGSNFSIGYWGLGVVVHSNATIGENVTIGQNVTIGRNFGDISVPIIGNDTYIGAGSVVFGEIRVGDNVIVGANTVVNKDVPDNATVVGNPMRIVQQGRHERYYNLK